MSQQVPKKLKIEEIYENPTEAFSSFRKFRRYDKKDKKPKKAAEVKTEREKEKNAPIVLDDDSTTEIIKKHVEPQKEVKKSKIIIIDDDNDESELKPTEKVTAKKGPIKKEEEIKVKKLEKKSSTDDLDSSVHFLNPDDIKTSPKKFNFVEINAKKQASHDHSVESDKFKVENFEKDCLKDLTFVITGDLSISRDALIDFIKELGGRITGNVSSKTSFLVVGNDPGNTKVTKAKDIGVKMVNEDGLFELVTAKSERIKSKNEKKELKPVKSAFPLKSSPSKSSQSTFPLKSSQGSLGVSNLEIASSQASSSKISYSLKQPISAVFPSKSKLSVENTPPINVHSSSNITSKISDSANFVFKYAPSNTNELIGQKSNVDHLKNFLKNFAIQHKLPGAKKAVLLSGPPGIGKTTMAHLVANELGYDVLEMNASEVRNKSAMDDIVKEVLGSKSISEFFKNVDATKNKKASNKVLIMDEVDGMGAGDRGGMQALIQLLKKTKIPVICICNDRQSPKVRSLANYCLDLRFHRPSAAQVKPRFSQIARQEGISFDTNALEELVTMTQGDLRQMLNILESFKAQGKTVISFSEAKNIDKKNVDMNIFTIGQGLFSDKSIDERFEMYFIDYQLAPLFVQENYLKVLPKGNNDLDRMLKFTEASEVLSMSDLIERKIFGSQEFSLLPTHAAFSSIIPVSKLDGHLKGRLDFPAVLGNISKTNKCWRLLRELSLHMSLVVSGDKVSIRQSYFSSLVVKIFDLIKGDKLEDAVNMLVTYCLTKEDWDAFLELWLGADLSKQIPTQKKTAFTKLYNKSAHMVPFAVQDLKKLKANKEKQATVDFGEGEQEETGSVEDEEDDTGEGEDKMIVLKNKLSSKGSKSKTTAKNQTKAKPRAPKKK